MQKKKLDNQKQTKETTKSIKLFVDVDDEILDIIDQIEAADSDKILLILPKSSLIGSSTVNLKLLSKKLLTLDKAVILITSSELVTNKAHEASLITKIKVEEVDQEVWKDAFMRMESLKDKIKGKKDELITQRKEKPEAINIKPIIEKEETDTEELVTGEEEEEEVEVIQKEAEIKLPPKPVPYVHKVINIEGFTFMPGGDIKPHIEKVVKKNIIIEPDVQASIPEEKISLPSSTPTTHSLVGQDITSTRNDKVGRTGLYGGQTRRSASKGKSLIKKILILLIILIPLIFIYRSNAETLEIQLEIETQQIELTEEVIADVAIQEVDLTTKKIPVYKTTSTKSMSDSDATTGEGIKGDKATGVMDFFNKTQTEINLPAGTMLTTINKNLTFYLNAAAKIPPAVSDITPSKLESVPIIAAQPGEEYNISDTDVKIEGFNPNSQLSGRIFRAVKGGTAEKVKILTQEDVDRLKASLTTTLNRLLTEDIDKSLDKDAIKLPNSSNVTEKRFEVTPNIGEPAEEFSIIALEYEMSILTINQDDLDKLADSIISEKYGIEEESEIDAKQAATFENLQLGENGQAKFTIRKQGRIKANINESVIKAAVENVELNEIGSKLSEIKEIKDYKVVYKPTFLPGFLQRVPADKSKIEITIQE